MAILDDIKALQCEPCTVGKVWICSDCLDIPDDAYEVLSRNLHLHWFCKSCEAEVHQGKPNSSLVDELKRALDQVMVKLIEID